MAPPYLIMRIAKATDRYEAWLGRHVRIVNEDIAFKHEQMRSAVFPFLRATYYRWAQIWEDVCGEAARAQSAGGGRSPRGELRNVARY
jgi:hypothetical protein